MALSLPNGSNVFLPKVPPDLSENAGLSEYLQKLVTALEERFRKDFDNTHFIVSTGTSGSFTDSAGNTITVESGIITSLL